VKLPQAPQADSPFWRFWEMGTSVHVAAYKLSHGRIGGHSMGAPVVLVESVGRKSGKRRTHPLICGEDGDNLVVVASKGGVDRHPAWYLNLMDNPQTTAYWRGDKRQVHARDATDAERERLWPMMVSIYRPYESYQRRTERKLPVVILERIDG
jgi:F420H(2)-dependent quinone reductase